MFSRESPEDRQRVTKTRVSWVRLCNLLFSQETVKEGGKKPSSDLAAYPLRRFGASLDGGGAGGEKGVL